MGSLRGKLYYEEDVGRFKIDKKIIMLPLEADVSNIRLENSGRESEYFTSANEIGPASFVEEEEEDQEGLLVLLVRDNEPQ